MFFHGTSIIFINALENLHQFMQNGINAKFGQLTLKRTHISLGNCLTLLKKVYLCNISYFNLS